MKYAVGTEVLWYSFHSTSLHSCSLMLSVHSKFTNVIECTDKKHILWVLASTQY